MIPNKSPLSCNSQNRVFRPYLKTSLQQVIAAKWAVDVINAQSGSQDLKIGKTTRILGLPTTPIYTGCPFDIVMPWIGIFDLKEPDKNFNLHEVPTLFLQMFLDITIYRYYLSL